MFIRKKKKLPPPTPPRSIDEITRAYQQASFQAGQAQYQIYVHTEDLKKINAELMRLNEEAAARQAIDKQAPATEPTQTAEVPSES